MKRRAKAFPAVLRGTSTCRISIWLIGIYKGSAQQITYVDAGVGTVGIMSTLAIYYSGIEIPFVGEAVFIYGTARLTWDVFFYLGANYGPMGAYFGTNKWSGR